MTARDAGLVALGFVAGYMVAGLVLYLAANDVAATDRIVRALRVKYGGRTQGLS